MKYLAAIDLARSDNQLFGKLLLGALLMLSASCVPLVGQLILMGWGAVAAQRWIQGKRDELPRLDFDGDYLIRLLGVGFRVFVVQLVVSLAFIPAVLVCVACMLVPMFAMNQSGDNATIAIGLTFLAAGASIFVTIPISMIVLCATTRAQLSDDISVGLQFGKAIDMAKRMWSEILLALLISGLASFALTLLGLLACAVGVYLVIPLVMLIPTIAMAQIYELYAATTGDDVTIASIPEADPDRGRRGPEPAGF